jgi:Ankyrin repeats (3 copies)/Ankyrin repeat
MATRDRMPKLKLIVNADLELREAVLADDADRVAAWLARGADANTRDSAGRTPLFAAIQDWAHPGIAELLIAHGADVRARDLKKSTPLHQAAFFGNAATIGLLLDHGALIDARDADGWTPLHSAARIGRVEETAFLVGRDANVRIRDEKGRTPLDAVLENDLLEGIWEPLQQLLSDGPARTEPAQPHLAPVQTIDDRGGPESVGTGGKYQVWHAKDLTGMILSRMEGEPYTHGYTHVANVHASSLDQVFQITNHLDKPWPQNPDVQALIGDPRSTYTGDVIIDPQGQPYCVVSQREFHKTTSPSAPAQTPRRGKTIEVDLER